VYSFDFSLRSKADLKTDVLDDLATLKLNLVAYLLAQPLAIEGYIDSKFLVTFRLRGILHTAIGVSVFMLWGDNSYVCRRCQQILIEAMLKTVGAVTACERWKIC
jgi:hypothetical protein